MIDLPYVHPTTIDVPDAREASIAFAFDAVAALTAAGAVDRARQALASAVERTSALPPTRAARELLARSKVERARIGWLAAGRDPECELAHAFELLIEAQHALGEIAPPSARADVAATIAGIACDLGDGASLERARTLLEGTVAALLREGATFEAATLLDDQAAIELRMGHAQRVSPLLDRAMEILAERVAEAPDDTCAALHFADVRRFFGRIPLHGAIAGATRTDAVAAAVAHCEVAAATYARLKRPRELARTLETGARLEMLRENVAEAETAFGRALDLSRTAGDAVGLARITGGLAELLISTGAPEHALRALAASIDLNQRKGSPLGLASDERLLGSAEAALEQHSPPDLALEAELAAVRARLADAIAATSGAF